MCSGFFALLQYSQSLVCFPFCFDRVHLLTDTNANYRVIGLLFLNIMEMSKKKIHSNSSFYGLFIPGKILKGFVYLFVCLFAQYLLYFFSSALNELVLIKYRLKQIYSVLGLILLTCSFDLPFFFFLLNIWMKSWAFAVSLR